MSNQRADRNAIDELPDFLADPTTATTGEDSAPGAAPDGFDEQAELDAAPVDDQGEASDGQATPARATRFARHSRRDDGHVTIRTGSTGMIVASVLLLVAGAGLGAAQSQGQLAALTGFGVTPAMLLLAGVVCAVGAAVRRHGAADQALLAERIETGPSTGDEFRENLAYLVSAQQAQAQRPPAAGEELQRVLVTLERHDEKINNLTKAMKMYGKPLMEIANQVADIAGAVNHTRTHVEAVADATRTGFTRIESGRQDQGLHKEVEDVHMQVLRVEEQLQKAMTGLGERIPRPDAMPQLADRLESQVRSIAQRIDDSSRQQTQAIEKITRHDSTAATEKMAQQFEGAIQRLRTDLENLKAANLGALESCVREIHREISGVATTTAQIQHALRSGGGRAGGAAAAATAATAAVTPANSTPSPSAQTSAAPSPAAAAGDGAGANDAQAGVAQNQAGTRATSSKNVLGAIAKLKQMKG